MVTSKGYEIGLNIGLLARRNFSNDKFSIYGIISSGPHFISGVPERQAPGFLFSDNIFIGISPKIYKMLYLDFRLGFRHMSNMDLKEPNKGINNAIVNCGLFYSF